MRAMILAAGRGERMRPLTDRTPKPLLTVAGKPMIQYHIEALAAAGMREIVINLAWLGQQIRAAIGDGSQFGVRVHYSDEGDAALETGGGVFQALPFLAGLSGTDPFVVVSGDVWTEYPLGDVGSKLSDTDIAHFVVVPNPDFHARGDFGLADGRLTDSGERYTYANIGVMRPEFFAGCQPGKFPLAPLMFDWIRKDRVSGELFRGVWHNVGTPQQLQQIDRERSA
ncbi:N-acetylmuramate alpha-1-phosphate uridylyltransferase MurU [Steroidobacter agaridevorans]|uniref:N-acetylmuramate alpha-1-phosphate uridylyltransferase MurU n=1 Tax=Steroidobacter agaridevorans TaxID=2695856 RepID=UPI0013249ECE|nr:nucleotidyltransferase family protein [Steroidobacter agaridevorans]GFE86142.1 mannose-1-phosphate guanylyltransferase [Steroidobacter agaridevorans]